MRRVSSRQRLVSWDAFDASAPDPPDDYYDYDDYDDYYYDDDYDYDGAPFPLDLDTDSPSSPSVGGDAPPPERGTGRRRRHRDGPPPTMPIIPPDVGSSSRPFDMNEEDTAPSAPPTPSDGQMAGRKRDRWFPSPAAAACGGGGGGGMKKSVSFSDLVLPLPPAAAAAAADAAAAGTRAPSAARTPKKAPPSVDPSAGAVGLDCAPPPPPPPPSSSSPPAGRWPSLPPFPRLTDPSPEDRGGCDGTAAASASAAAVAAPAPSLPRIDSEMTLGLTYMTPLPSSSDITELLPGGPHPDARARPDPAYCDGCANLAHLSDDAILRSLSFLSAADVRSASASCARLRRVSVGGSGGRHLWMGMAGERWPVLGRVADAAGGAGNVRLVDRAGIVTAAASPDRGGGDDGGEDGGGRGPNLPVLLGLSSARQPSGVDPSFYRPSPPEPERRAPDGGGGGDAVDARERRAVHRRAPQFRAFDMRPPSPPPPPPEAAPSPEEVAMDAEEHDEDEDEDEDDDDEDRRRPRRRREAQEILAMGSIGLPDRRRSTTVPVVQFTGAVGSGDRCVRSDHPLPRPTASIRGAGASSSPRRSARPHPPSDSREGGSSSSSLTSLSSSPTASILELLRRAGAYHPDCGDASGSDYCSRTPRPFVSPFVGGDGKAEVDLTPRLVAYFEVSIVPRDRDREPKPHPYVDPDGAERTGPTPPPDAGRARPIAAAAAAAAAPARRPPRRAFVPLAPVLPHIPVMRPMEMALPFPLRLPGTLDPLDDDDGADDAIPAHVHAVAAAAPPPSSDCVAVGVSTSSFPPHHRMPGWDTHSYGYHGDDGGIFHAAGDMERLYGPTFGPGDTVGCGVDYMEGGIFFTLNGEFLGYGWTDVDIVGDGESDLYPTVGVDSDCPVACNFGDRPFAFDIGAFAYGRHGDTVRRYLGGLVRGGGGGGGGGGDDDDDDDDDDDGAGGVTDAVVVG